jgi:hypothetical protein
VNRESIRIAKCLRSPVAFAGGEGPFEIADVAAQPGQFLVYQP